MTEHAPQSPVAQPSLVPVRWSSSRSDVEQAAARRRTGTRSARRSRVRVDVELHALARSSRALERRRRRRAGQHAGDLAAVLDVPRLSAIGRAAALAAAAARASAASSPREPTSAAAAAGTRIAVGATAPSATRALRAAAVRVERDRDARADHRDVHLGARDEAQVGVGRCARPAAGCSKPTSSSPGPSTFLPGRGVERSRPATARSPRGPAIAQRAPTAISAGTVSAAGEALHRFPPTDARPWICVEPIRSTASTRPGTEPRRARRARRPAAAGTAAPSQSRLRVERDAA